MNITVINDPANITNSDFHQVADGTILLDWLIEQYGENGFDVPTKIYAGSISQLSEINVDDFNEMNKPINGDIYIIHHPLGLDPITIGFIIAVVVAIAVVVLMPTPELPEGIRQAKGSPNNALSGQSNVARALDRVPDIFGQIKSFPDLIAPTVTEFINHIKFQREYMCIGRGFHVVDEVKSGDTLISSIAGSTATFFQPGTAPAQVLKTRQSNEVAGQIIKGPNEQPTTTMDALYQVTYVVGTDKATITSNLPGENIWGEFLIGQTIVAENLNANDGVSDFNLDGSYVIDDITDQNLVLLDAAAENANWSNFDLTPRNVITTGGTPTISTPVSEINIGPFVVPGDNNDEIWVDFQGQKGLARGGQLNEPTSVDLEVFIEEIDDFDIPTGPSFTIDITLKEDTREPRFWTFKFDSSDGVIKGKRYRATVTRTNDSSPTATDVVDEIKWTRLAGIEDIATPDTTGTTRVVIETQATEQVASIQERKFNMLATRKVVTWDGSAVVGDIDTGVGLVVSRRMADVFLHYSLDEKLGARAITDLDVNAIFAIQASLDAVFNGEKGEFSFTFDGKNTPALEEMRQIGQAARSFLFRDGSIFSMIRDQEQPISRAMFNRRNKKPNSETMSMKFNKPLDFDGVALEYTDIDDGITRTITLPDDLPAGDPNFGLPQAANAKSVDGIGIAQYVQAWDRAQYELNRLIYARTSVDTKVTAEGILMPLNARIEHVDGTRLTTLESDGEIKAVSGLIITTSERCIFELNTIYSVILRDDIGDPISPIIVTERTDTEFGFVLSSAPSIDINVRGDNDYQRGTLYNFGPDGNELSRSYLVQRKQPDSDGNVQLELINYSDHYFDADNQIPPPKATI